MTELLSIAYADPGASRLGKVAAVGLSFWILKIITTTAGDIGGDLLSISLGLGYALSLAVALTIFAAGAVAQIRSSRHRPWLYWLLIFVSSTVGAELSDTLDRGLHLGYIAGAGLLLACLLVMLAVWYLRLGRLNIYPMTRHEEGFYWLAVIVANSLGSVLGDLFGDRWGLGLSGTLILSAGVLALLWLLHRFTRTDKALLFWTGFVFSRA